MKSLTLSCTGIVRVTETGPYKLAMTVTVANGISRAIFVKQRVRTVENSTTDNFVAVASSTQLEDLAELSPSPDTSYYRDYTFEIVGENPDYLDWVRQNVLSEAQNLLNNENALAANYGTSVYTLTAV